MELVMSLIQQGLSPNVQDYAGWTPLVSLTVSLLDVSMMQCCTAVACRERLVSEVACCVLSGPEILLTLSSHIIHDMFRSMIQSVCNV